MPYRLLCCLCLLLLPAAASAGGGRVDWEQRADWRCGVLTRSLTGQTVRRSGRPTKAARACLRRAEYCRRMAMPRQTRQAQRATWDSCMDGEAYRPR